MLEEKDMMDVNADPCGLEYVRTEFYRNLEAAKHEFQEIEDGNAIMPQHAYDALILVGQAKEAAVILNAQAQGIFFDYQQELHKVEKLRASLMMQLNSYTPGRR